MPRLVLDRVHRPVASTAERMVAPRGPLTGRGHRRGDGDRAREEVLVPGVVKVPPGRDVPRLGRAHLEQAGELCRRGDVLAGHAFTARASCSTRAPATSMPGGLLETLPPRDAVHLEHVHRAVAGRQQIDARVLRADRRRGSDRERRPFLRQPHRTRGAAPRQVGAPALGPALDRPEDPAADHEGADVAPFVVDGALEVVDAPDLLDRAEHPEGHLLVAHPHHARVPSSRTAV